MQRAGAAALLASLKSFQQPRRGWSGENGDPFPGVRPSPSLPHPWHPLTLGTLAAPDLPRHPPGPRGRTGQRAMVNHVFVADHPQPHPACCPVSDADQLRCASEERYWRYRTALGQQGCGRHRAGDDLAARNGPRHPACSLNTAAIQTRSIACRRRSRRCARTSAASSWSREVQRIHDHNSSARVGELVHQAGHSQRELVHRSSMLSLSAAPPRLARPVF
jgi:hypothetical protein